MTTWSLVTVLRAASRCSVRNGTGAVHEGPQLKAWASLMDLLADWTAAGDVLRGLDVEHGPVILEPKLLAPLRYPAR